MEDTLKLNEIFAVLKKRLWMILMMMVLACATSAAITFYVITPVYQASTQILINPSSGNKVNYDQIQTNLELMNTFEGIMQSPLILGKVISDLNLNQTVDSLNQNISISSDQNSQLIWINVRNTDPEMAAKIANKVASVFQSQVVQIMNIDNVSILSKASAGNHPVPVQPNPIMNMAIALALGGVIGVGLALFLEYIRNTVQSERDVKEDLGTIVLGEISSINARKVRLPKNQVQTKRELGGESIGS